MLAIAAELGYSESAFVTPRADGDYDVRYFSPQAEVAVLRPRDDRHRRRARRARRRRAARVFHTQAGAVPVETSGSNGAVTATLTSVVPHVEDVPDELLDAALAALALDAATSSTPRSRRASASPAPAT